MIRILAFLFALLLSCPAALADVQAQVNAPAHIENKFQSNTGKTVINVDAEVIVPNADKVPIYSLTPRYFTLEEVNSMCDACFGDAAYDGDREIVRSGPTGLDNRYVHLMLNRRGQNKDFGMYESELDGKLNYAQVVFFGQTAVDYSPAVTETIFQSEGQPRSCSVTAQEAQRQADALVAAFAPDFVLMEQAVIRGDESTMSDNGRTSKKEAWIMFYTRSMPLPVTCDLTPITNDTYALVGPSEQITVIVNDAGIAQVEYIQPHEITGILQEDSVLLPFDQIMQVAASLMPLKYASSERYYADNRVQVTSIRLGYMRVMRQDKPGEFMLTPVWDFYGSVQLRRQKNGKVVAGWDLPFNSLLTINAIDGTVIDRQYGY